MVSEGSVQENHSGLSAAWKIRTADNNNCLYGYRKDPNVKHHWLVDEEAAAIVRRIYQMACEGHGPYKIARILTKEKVDSPGYYFTKHAYGLRRDYMKETHAHDWNGETVSRILDHQEYSRFFMFRSVLKRKILFAALQRAASA